MPASRGVHHLSRANSNSTRSIAAHPCKERKDGAPSAGIVDAEIVKGGHPPPGRLGFWVDLVDCIEGVRGLKIPRSAWRAPQDDKDGRVSKDQRR
jgi:hypothetical protein